MGLDSAGTENSDLMSELHAARRFLSQNLEKAEMLAAELEASHFRLQGIGERLPALAAAMRPTREQTMDVSRFSSRLDRAMAPAAFILKKYELLHSLEPKLLAAPEENLDDYLRALSELDEALKYLAENRNLAVQRLQEAVQFVEETQLAGKPRMQKINSALAAVKALESKKEQPSSGSLMKIALKKLQEEFYRILLENSSVVNLPPKIGKNERSNKLSPPVPMPAIQKLQSIFNRMSVGAQVDQCAKVFLEVRSGIVRESLLRLQPKYLVLAGVKAVDSLDWSILDVYIKDWRQQFQVAVQILFKGERILAKRVFLSVDPASESKLFARLAHEAMVSFVQFGQSVARGKKRPKKLFSLLDTYECLRNLDPSIAEVFEGEGCSEIRLRVRELQKQLAHGSCQAFKEFTQKMQAQKRGPPPPDGGILKLSKNVINFTDCLVSESYDPIMNQVLLTEQSWQSGAVRESAPLPQAVLRIMEILENTFLNLSREYNLPPLSHIFLMNNYNYLFTHAKASKLGSLLGDPWLKQCRSKVQQHALAYQKEGWGRVLSQLHRDGSLLSIEGRVASQATVTRRLKAFNTAFEETCAQHNKFLIADADLREGTRLAVIQATVSAYRSFIQSYRPLIQHGDSNSFLKFSAEILEEMLNELFQGSSEKNTNPIHIDLREFR